MFLGLMLTSCQGTQKAEQSGYKVFFAVMQRLLHFGKCNMSRKQKVGKNLWKNCFLQWKGRLIETTIRVFLPEGLTAAVSTLKDGRLTIDFNDAYKQMDDTREVLLRAAVVQTMTQITDVREVVFTVAGEALLNSENQAVGSDACLFVYQFGG